jgi:protein-ribulosamine 3-kinase
MNKQRIAEHLRALADVELRTITPVSGGSIAASYQAVTGDGGTLFIKTEPSFPDMFEKEARGLKSLAAGNAVRIPEVIGVNEEILILEFLPSVEKQLPSFHSALGSAVARLHRNTNPEFGFTEDNYIGATPQVNRPTSTSWKEFFVVHRLEYQVRLAERNHYDDREITSLVHRVERMIDRLVPEDGEPPALLHGDLWSGNVLCLGDGTPALIDPAVYYGHREMELGMTRLFGGFDERFYAAYHETYPLNDEWERRTDLYSLYHLFNHLNLFGRSYQAQIYDTLKRLLQ